MGISEERFWDLTPKEMRIYQKADQMKKQRNDYMNWMQGLYIYDAVSVAIARGINGSKNAKYREEPLFAHMFDDDGLTQEQIDERELRKMLLQEEVWASSLKNKGMAETVID